MSIVQEPHTSSRQLQSHATGATRRPSCDRARAAILCRMLMTSMLGSYGSS